MLKHDYEVTKVQYSLTATVYRLWCKRCGFQYNGFKEPDLEEQFISCEQIILEDVVES